MNRFTIIHDCVSVTRLRIKLAELRRVFVLTGASCLWATVMTVPMLAAGEKTLLFVDDHDILYRSGTRRVLHQPQRSPVNPLLVGPDGKNQFAYCSVYRDPKTGRYQMWYQLSFGGRGVCYAESLDGLKWVTPDLGLIESKGGAVKNIVLTSDDHYGASVVVDPVGGDTSRRYKMVYCSIPDFAGPFAHPTDHRGPDGGMYVAFSSDGINWVKEPGLRILASYGRSQQPPLRDGPKYPWGKPLSVSDVLDVSWDPIEGKYVVYSKSWIDAPDGKMYWKRSIVFTDSKDFLNWSAPQVVMAPDENDGLRPQQYGGTRKGVQLHGAPVFVHAGVYFSLLQVADYETNGLQPIELAISRDGKSWTRPFRGNPFIPVGSAADFDGGRIWSNSTPIILDNEIRFYYGAYQHPWKFDKRPYPWDSKQNIPKTGLGLAVLPLDRFAGVRPIDKVGQITLRPRMLNGATTMKLNGDASKGSMWVELLDAAGYRLPGYTKGEANVISGDNLKHAVTWKKAALRDVANEEIMVRIHLDNAEVFAVTIE